MKHLYLLILLLPLLNFAPTVAAQGEDWCRFFDFTVSSQGWEAGSILDNPLDLHAMVGRYTPGAGFSVANYVVSLPAYALTGVNMREIHIHRSFSGQITQIATFAQGADYSHVVVDYNSSVDYGGDEDTFAGSEGASPYVIAFPPRTVDGTLGIGYADYSQEGFPMLTVISAIAVSGVGSNPFGESNCRQEFDLNLPAIVQPLATANAIVNTLPDDLTAPQGVPLLSNENGRQLFSYAKWLLSPAITEEYAGPFAPIIQHLQLALTATFVLSAVYVVLFLAVWFVRFAIWLVKWLLRVLDIVLQIAQAGFELVVEGAKFVLKLLT